MGKRMDDITRFSQYLTEEKHASANTVSAYLRDIHQLWEYLRDRDPALYRRCRYRLTNMGTNIPGYQGRKLSVKLYRLARKIYKFN